MLELNSGSDPSTHPRGELGVRARHPRGHMAYLLLPPVPACAPCAGQVLASLEKTFEESWPLGPGAQDKKAAARCYLWPVGLLTPCSPSPPITTLQVQYSSIQSTALTQYCL